MVIEGFRTSGDQSLVSAAHEMAKNWLISSYQAYIRTHSMFEKYNVSSQEHDFAGSGGEYEVQVPDLSRLAYSVSSFSRLASDGRTV